MQRAKHIRIDLTFQDGDPRRAMLPSIVRYHDTRGRSQIPPGIAVRPCFLLMEAAPYRFDFRIDSNSPVKFAAVGNKPYILWYREEGEKGSRRFVLSQQQPPDLKELGDLELDQRVFSMGWVQSPLAPARRDPAQQISWPFVVLVHHEAKQGSVELAIVNHLQRSPPALRRAALRHVAA